MVSEPNFVLGIKQNLKQTKKILTCTPPSEVTHTYLLDLDSTASRSRHGSQLCLDPEAQAIRVSPYQICAHQAFACRNRSHRRAPRHPPRKTQKSGQPKSSQAPPRAADSFGKSLTRRLRFLTSDRLLGTHAALKASTSTDLQNLRNRPSSDLTRALTRFYDFWLLLHAPVIEHVPDTRRTQLLISSDVIG